MQINIKEVYFMKKSLAKSLALLMMFSFGFSSNVLAASPEEAILKENERASEIEMLIDSCGLEVLSDEELSDLNLDQESIEVLPESMSVKEIEAYIIEKKKQLEKEIEIVTETEIYLDDIDNEDNNSHRLNSSLKSSPETGTNIVTSTYSQLDTTTFNADFRFKSYCAATVQYDYVQYPLDPPEISNEKFISWDNGDVYEVYSDGSYKLLSVDSSKVTKENDKRLAHAYKFTYGMYVTIPIGGNNVTVKLGEGKLDGTSYYNLSI